VKGVLPEFLRELHRSSAKALNASQGQWENLWSAEQRNAVKLGDDDDVIDKMAYVITNPVDSGLVACPEEWPGLNLWGDQQLRATRPEEYFDPMGTAPEAELLAVASPPLSVGTSYEASDWRRRLTRAVATKYTCCSDFRRKPHSFENPTASGRGPSIQRRLKGKPHSFGPRPRRPPHTRRTVI
jgi:hypothetical protein